MIMQKQILLEVQKNMLELFLFHKNTDDFVTLYCDLLSCQFYICVF